jgi:hydroxypyruvate isomerase
MFRELPVLERYAAARDAGFDGVEIQNLAEGELTPMVSAAREANLPVVLINVGVGDYAAGGAGLSGVPGREDDFYTAFERTLKAAEKMDARFVHLGPSRVPEGATCAACLDAFRRNAERALGLVRARSAGLRLLLEPMNCVDAPTALFSDVDSAAEFLRHNFDGVIGLQLDLYHAAMNGDDLVRLAHAHQDVIAHVQFSDVPGRAPPGEGRINFEQVFQALEGAGYGGWFGAEYFPTVPTRQTLGWLPKMRGGR